MPARRWSWRIAKAAIFLACLTPLLLLSWWTVTDQLSANPIEDITHHTGDWTLRFLMITLAVTPVRRLTRWGNVIRFRRMFGLFAFFYGSLHLMTYLWLDQFFDMAGIIKDIAKRPYVTVGFTGFVLMIPLAVTSTRKWIGRLGGKRWQMLHRLIYVSAVAGVLHYLWLVKADTLRPVRYGMLLAVLLGFRVWHVLQPRLSGLKIPTAVGRSKIRNQEPGVRSQE